MAKRAYSEWEVPAKGMAGYQFYTLRPFQITIINTVPSPLVPIENSTL